MNVSINYLLAHERHCDLIEEAERSRLQRRYAPASVPRRRWRLARAVMPHRGSNHGGEAA